MTFLHFYLFQLSPVYGGDTIFFGWFAGIYSEVFRRYTTAGSGKPLVHISPHPSFVKKDTGLGLSKFGPWNERLSSLLETLKEAGIVGHRIRHNMGVKYLQELGESAAEGEGGGPAAFKLDHFQGIFIVLAAGMGVAALVLGWEARMDKGLV